MSEAPPFSEIQPAPEETTSGRLKSRVIRGSVWTIAGYGASQVLRLAGNLVFAKLLFPEAFGILALVSIFVQGLTMFSDIGIGPSIIQNRRGEDIDFLNTAWTIQVVRGVLLWIVSAIGAGPFAAWYGEPQLASLVPVAALASILSGFTSTKLFSRSRKLSLARITVIDFVGQTLGLIAMVVWCFVTHSVWAIVFGSLIGAAAKTILSHVALDGERNRFTFERAAGRELLGFGRWIFVSTALTFLAMQVDRLMLGKFVPIGQLGVYSIAMNLASLAPTIANTLASSVLFPLLAHHSRTDAQASERALHAARAIILRGGLFMLAGLALLSPAFFRILYDERYSDAAWMAQLLTVPMWTWLLMVSAYHAVLAAGESRALAIANGCSLVGKLAACALGFHYGGLTGFILGLALGNLAGHVAIAFALRRLGTHIFRRDLVHTSVALAWVGGGVLAQRFAMTLVKGRWLGWVELAVALAVVVPLGVQATRLARQSMARR